MSTFSNKNFNAAGYSKSRPSYNGAFYAQLSNYIKGQNWNQPRLLDIGCGPGTATVQLHDYFKDKFAEYVGIDISPVMIEKASQSKLGSVRFEVAGYDNYKTDTKFQLVTAAECAHWFDFDVFQDQVLNNYLAKDGIVAIWGYCDSVIEEYPDLDQLYRDVAYSDTALGPYWQQPGRNLLRSLLKDFKFNPDKFCDIQEVYYDASKRDNLEHPRDGGYQPLQIRNTWTIQEFIDYMKTFSAYHSWREDEKNKNKQDPMEQFWETASRMHPELTLNTKVTISWSTFYKFAKAK